MGSPEECSCLGWQKKQQATALSKLSVITLFKRGFVEEAEKRIGELLEKIEQLQAELEKVQRWKETLTDVRVRVKEIIYRHPQESQIKRRICEDILTRIEMALEG